MTRVAWLRNRVFREGWLDRAAVEVGQPGLTLHELRHTAASLAVSSGAHVKVVQRILGHASAAVTLDVYSDLFDDDLDDVAERLDAVAGDDGAGEDALDSVRGFETRKAFDRTNRTTEF